MSDYLTHKDIDPILNRDQYPCPRELEGSVSCAPQGRGVVINFRETNDWDMVRGAFGRWGRALSNWTVEDAGSSLEAQDAS